MQVSNAHLGNVKPSQVESSTDPAPTAPRSQASAASQASSHTSSADLARLLALVRQVPPVRREILESIAERLTDGDYLTPDAAARTAQAILEAAD